MKTILLSVTLVVAPSLCGLAAGPSAVPKGALCLTFDDHYLDSWCRELPRFERFGAHATFFISSSISSTDAGKMRQLQDAGHSLGLHGQSHAPALDVVAQKGVDGFIAQEVVPQLQSVAPAGLRIGSWRIRTAAAATQRMPRCRNGSAGCDAGASTATRSSAIRSADTTWSSFP